MASSKCYAGRKREPAPSVSNAVLIKFLLFHWNKPLGYILEPVLKLDSPSLCCSCQSQMSRSTASAAGFEQLPHFIASTSHWQDSDSRIITRDTPNATKLAPQKAYKPPAYALVLCCRYEAALPLWGPCTISGPATAERKEPAGAGRSSFWTSGQQQDLPSRFAPLPAEPESWIFKAQLPPIQKDQPRRCLVHVLQWKHKPDSLQLRTGKKWLYRDSAEITSALFVKDCYLKETNLLFS